MVYNKNDNYKSIERKLPKIKTTNQSTGMTMRNSATAETEHNVDVGAHSLSL